ncbi:MAG: hypothetical protein KDN20_15580 [Verrucomicrobiae bacterium]|nr:hypothetical protein [Verrucomicrobiae bacterium]
MAITCLLVWRLWHLTPEGWVAGSKGFGEEETEIIEKPASAVLTCRYALIEECLTSAYGRERPFVMEFWRAKLEGDEIEKWLSQFGTCPETFSYDR